MPNIFLPLSDDTRRFLLDVWHARKGEIAQKSSGPMMSVLSDDNVLDGPLYRQAAELIARVCGDEGQAPTGFETKEEARDVIRLLLGTLYASAPKGEGADLWQSPYPEFNKTLSRGLRAVLYDKPELRAGMIEEITFVSPVTLKMQPGTLLEATPERRHIRVSDKTRDILFHAAALAPGENPKAQRSMYESLERLIGTCTEDGAITPATGFKNLYTAAHRTQFVVGTLARFFRFDFDKTTEGGRQYGQKHHYANNELYTGLILLQRQGGVTREELRTCLVELEQECMRAGVSLAQAHEEMKCKQHKHTFPALQPSGPML